MNEFFKVIGRVVSNLKKGSKIPPDGYSGEIHVFEEFEAGLRGIENNSFLVLVALFGTPSDKPLLVYPRGDFSQPLTGVFSLRSPVRPNPIALDTVELIKREQNILKVSGLDFYDETPILDIKSYSPFNEIILSATQEKSFIFTKLSVEERRELLIGFIKKSLGNISQDSIEAIEFFLELINKNTVIRSKKTRYKVKGSLKFLEAVVLISGATIHSDRLEYEFDKCNKLEIIPSPL
ncbi:MAG: tRNA (N6-threonylcarbamoyladenosine(37)-N6)-methyltransferase TrmO [Fervidicoccus fontis]|uniref:tRNA-Thr(GGU) m(6)t(6)A37 methyltransferase TsaA n=1 Tax=Thermodesulfobium acidiphilum TaxID=1794699 RepID=A0A2R4VY65_THEAF|nr:tRNA (N6-threonylcarbamoyladenosine(37)-N6)-methyltransferase TrmO [Thermodesulfobium acidiphilum]AWB09489.1 tRNA-Thr(GGU) m(6)t(6)A37 methyltransferase TsaA [Thermodesulfobium acidiphilum]PMB77801.1 MAG: tRNA (N6-threonylcarbamoyladenosine(37)-N6)-methyltransferase TrmO [Fervidicoccus fontis]HEM56278.1 tRNA (N6-threonylcarbamoyladenosine(37)-N6)-methyltransferase TrmO [Thermodesulfobium narugense]